MPKNSPRSSTEIHQSPAAISLQSVQDELKKLYQRRDSLEDDIQCDEEDGFGPEYETENKLGKVNREIVELELLEIKLIKDSGVGKDNIPLELKKVNDLIRQQLATQKLYTQERMSTHYDDPGLYDSLQSSADHLAHYRKIKAKVLDRCKKAGLELAEPQE